MIGRTKQGLLSRSITANRIQKVNCCGGALAFSEPDKSYAQIKIIIESAYDFGAEMTVIPLYSQLMTAACGASAKEAGLDLAGRARWPEAIIGR